MTNPWIFGISLSFSALSFGSCSEKKPCTYHWRALQAKSRESRENMRGAASLGKKRQTLSLPPTCTQLVLCEKGKFSLDGSFSKNAPYKQKIIFHLTSIDKLSQKKIFFPWKVGRWYQKSLLGLVKNNRFPSAFQK